MRRRRRRNSGNFDISYMDSDSREIVELWILRILLRLNGNRDFLSSHIGGFGSDSLAYFLGLGKYAESDELFDKKEINAILKARLGELEQKSSFSYAKTLKRNIKKVSKLINLNNTERKILAFTIYLKYYDILVSAVRTLDDISTDRLVAVFSVLLEIKASKIKKAFSPQGRLAQSGLITVDRDGSNSIENKLDIISRDFADRMMTLDGDIEEMIRDSVRKCDKGELGINDFDHLSDDLSVLLPYLNRSLERKRKGVNILFYGNPGTGYVKLIDM